MDHPIAREETAPSERQEPIDEKAFASTGAKGHAEPAAKPRVNSLHDGFEEYLTPPPDAFERVLRTGLITLDANVLLDFYRFAKVTRADLARLLSVLDERLYVSHQAVDEFWRNREGTLQAYERSLTDVQSKLSSLKTQGESAVRQWANVISLPVRDVELTVTGWTRAVDALVNRLDQLGARHKSATSFDTNRDEIVRELSVLLDGRVGEAPSKDTAEAWRAEGARRQKQSIPPGYMDGHKDPGRAIGDYLVWVQVLEQARHHDADVLFVTRDQKEDWWHKGGGGHPLPRRELQAEFYSVTGRRLYMLKTPDFLRLGAEVFGLRVREASITDAARAGRRVRRFLTPGRQAIDKLGPRDGGTYLTLILRMVNLADGEPTYNELVANYRQEFPTISLDSEARRRVDNLFSLGLVDMDGNTVVVTRSGRDLMRSRDIGLLQQSFLQNIIGADEVLAALRGGETPKSLRDDPPLDMTRTQLDHVMGWLRGLDLVSDTREPEEADVEGERPNIGLT